MILPLATDLAAISSLATAGGTLVLAVATFAAVRSSQRSARLAEVALQEQRRPVLAPSRFDDPLQKIMFIERRWFHIGGGRGVAEHDDGNIYLVLSLRNVGSGIAVCQGWAARPGLQSSGGAPAHFPVEEFRTQTRDLYIPAGDIGLWQGALRDHRDAVYAQVAAAIGARESITIELLYSDQVGEQRTISRFGLMPYTSPEGEEFWLASGSRHWFLDRPGPRPEAQVNAAAETILRLEAERASAQEAEAAEAQEAEAAEAQEAEAAEAQEAKASPSPTA
jgi:hypothetical protein